MSFRDYQGGICKKSQNVGTRHARSVSLFVLAFPHSNVDVERVFSEVTPIKTKRRNRTQRHQVMTQSGLPSVLIQMQKCMSSSNKDYVVDLYLGGKLSLFPVLGNLQILDLETLACMHSMGSSDCSWTINIV